MKRVTTTTMKDITTSKFGIWYFPTGFLIIHAFMLFHEIEIWANIMVPAIIIMAAIALIPIYKEKTPNYRTVFFYMLGFFLFGIAEIFWAVLYRISNHYPSTNVYLAYFYTLPNVCFLMAILLYLFVHIKYFNLAQLWQDLLSAILLCVGFLIMAYFHAQLFGKVEINPGGIANFIFLLLNMLSLTILITMGISLRWRKQGIGGKIIMIALASFFIADSFYVSQVTNNTYVPYAFLDWTYVFSFVALSSGIRYSYLEYKLADINPEMGIKGIAYNEGPIRNLWMLFILPAINVFVCGFHYQQLLYFAVVIIIHLFVSLHIQNSIHMKRMLNKNTELNEMLKKKVLERTCQLQAINDDLNFLLKHDRLTGLHSRDFFFNMIDEKISEYGDGQMIYLIIVDIERFRVINDTYGNVTGDKVLKETGQRLLKMFGKHNCLARIDGNEFAILDFEEKDFNKMAEKLELLVEAFKEPVDIHPFNIQINIQAGVAAFPENAANRNELMNFAKTALEQVKISKNQSYAFYDENFYRRERRRQEIELALKKSDVGQEFRLYYQPEYTVKGQELYGMEALLRWKSPTLGFVSPAEFIPIAEETGMILEIGEWVMETAMEQIVEWNHLYDSDFHVGINVSGVQLQNTNFIERVKALIQKTGVSPGWINFEITESSTMESLCVFGTALTSLSKLGIMVSIDDFGTGYSSYSYIKEFSIDYLKIDKQLIDSITIKPNDAQVVKAIIAMAKALEIKTIAEGIETEEQVGMLRKMGCDIVQGYLLGRPVPAEEFALQHFLEEEALIVN